MGKLRSQDYICDECQIQWNEIIEFPDGVENHLDNCPTKNCGQCHKPARVALSAPRVMNNSYPDGQRRKTSPGWALTREAAKLRMERRNIDPKKRGEINQTIANVEQAAAGKTDLTKTT